MWIGVDPAFASTPRWTARSPMRTFRVKLDVVTVAPSDAIVFRRHRAIAGPDDAAKSARASRRVRKTLALATTERPALVTVDAVGFAGDRESGEVGPGTATCVLVLRHGLSREPGREIGRAEDDVCRERVVGPRQLALLVERILRRSSGDDRDRNGEPEERVQAACHGR
jgi:hypothetical protein